MPVRDFLHQNRMAHLLMTIFTGENHLSFIETSALDASNVELAFQNILTGIFAPPPFNRVRADINDAPRNLPNRIQQGFGQRRRCPGHHRCRHQHLSQQACRRRLRKGRKVLLNPLKGTLSHDLRALGWIPGVSFCPQMFVTVILGGITGASKGRES